MKIRKYKNSDLKEASDLIRNTFKRFNSRDATKKGVRDYIESYTLKEKNIEKIKKRFSRTSIFFVAEENKKIIGLIRGNPERISNLFVKADYHKKKIGKKLVERFEKEAIKKKSKLIKLKASIYSVPFYQRMGYKKTTGTRYISELKIQPMQKSLR